MKFLTTLEFAKAIGVSRATVVLWDKKGLLKPYMRTPTGYRQYTQEQIEEYKKDKALGIRKKPVRKYMTSTEFAEAIGVSPCTVIKWDNRGLLKPHHTTPSGRREYAREQVDEYLNGGRKTTEG